MFREEFTDELMSWFFAPQIIYEDFIENRDECIMEVVEWYGLTPKFKEENKREISSDRLSKRTLVTNRQINPYLTGNNYISRIYS